MDLLLLLLSVARQELLLLLLLLLLLCLKVLKLLLLNLVGLLELHWQCAKALAVREGDIVHLGIAMRSNGGRGERREPVA